MTNLKEISETKQKNKAVRKDLFEAKKLYQSKEYSKAEYLYGNTGAVDEITLALADQLGIQLSELNKNYLTSGSTSLSSLHTNMRWQTVQALRSFRLTISLPWRRH